MEANNMTYDEVLQNFKKLLKSNRLKYTKQRELIVEIIYNNRGHFTPEDIYNLIKERYPEVKLGIATVYRTLTLLEDANIVSSISFGTQGKKYEFGLGEHHDHLVCLECGGIEEFIDEIIERQQELIAKKHNFQMTNHIMKIIGVCNSCQAKKRE
ncbi:MAG TPA: transcriptional repressor [Campylobacterales bacterium]|nr:transcriptional repressor [Campylobacterales bacterium]HIP41366.1 transcriptional repressor [Campylobacterales bacterium]